MHAAINLTADKLGEYMANLKMIFAGNLRRLMRLYDFKAKDLAKQIKVSPSLVTHWRNGDKFPMPENIEKICSVMKVSYAEMFREDTDPAPGGPLDAEAALKALAKAFNYELKRRQTGAKE